MEFDVTTVLRAFSLTLLAGLATGIGSALAFLAKRTNTRMLATSLGFSAGVMLYVCFVEIFAQARDSLTQAYGEHHLSIYGFIAGMLVIALSLLLFM